MLAARARCGGLFSGLLALQGRSHEDPAGTAGDSFQGRKADRVKPKLARIIGHFHEIVIASERMATPLGHAHDRAHALADGFLDNAARPPKNKNPVAWTGPGILVAGTGFEPVTFGL